MSPWRQDGGPRALLLSPTKELATQSFRILKLLSKGTSALRCVYLLIV
jgi:ATP-dependent RNA helicase DDX52/ROK1